MICIYIGIIQQHSMCKGEQLLLHWISAERNRVGPNVIPNSGKVWQWERLENLANHTWFAKLKLSKLVLTINNLAIGWSINSPNFLLLNAQKESICQTFPICGSSHPIGGVKGPLFIMCVVYNYSYTITIIKSVMDLMKYTVREYIWVYGIFLEQTYL